MAAAVTVDQLNAKGHLRLVIYEDHLTGLGRKQEVQVCSSLRS
jgi:hypothetical protein